MSKKMFSKVISFTTALILAIGIIPTNLFVSAATPDNATVTKSAKWVDIENQIAEITVDVNAKDQQVGAVANTDIVFAVDNSTSALFNDKVSAIESFVKSVAASAETKNRVKIGVVKFAGDASVVNGITSDYNALLKKVDDKLGGLSLGFGTNIQAGIKKAEDMLSSSTAKNKIIIILSDGNPDRSYKITAGNFVNLRTQSDCINMGLFYIHRVKAVYDSFTPTAVDYNDTVVFDYDINKSITGKCQHGNNCSATASYRASVLDGTYYEANKASAAGIKMMAIKYGSSSSNVLSNIADSGNFFSTSSTSNAINRTFNMIRNTVIETVSEGVNAVLTETPALKIGSTPLDYSIVAGSIDKTIGSTTQTGNSISWNIGTLPNGKATLKYRVKINTPLPAGKNAIDFGTSQLNYNANGAVGTPPVPTSVLSNAGALNYYTAKFIGYTEDANRQLVETVLLEKKVAQGGSINAPVLNPTAGYTFTWPQSSYTNINSDLTIKATPEKKSFNVKFFDFDGNQIGNTQTLKYLESASEAVQPNEELRKFTAWSTNDWANVTSDLNVNALFDQFYVVKFLDDDGVKVLKTENVISGGNATPPTDTDKIGYTFKSWNGSYTNVTATTNITAVYEINKYPVTFIVKDLEDNTEKTIEARTDVPHFTKVTLPAYTLPEGYEIATDWNTPDTITGPTTVTLEIKKQSFLVKFFDFDGKQIGEAQTVKYGDSAKEEIQPNEEFRKFTAWSSNDWEAVKASLNINALYQQFYKVTFYDEDGKTVLGTANVIEGGKATPPTPPAKQGFEFDSWDSSFSEILQDTIVKANYKAVIALDTEEIPLANPVIDIQPDSIPTAGNPKTAEGSNNALAALLIGGLVSIAWVWNKKTSLMKN